MEYAPCFDGYECARLEVPLDWNEPGSSPRAAIAITRLPAQVPVTDPRYGGAILINPGGPGMSGVADVLNKGKMLQASVDLRADEPSSNSSHIAGERKYFDIIGFDPRGVNNTTPHLNCFPDAMTRKFGRRRELLRVFLGPRISLLTWAGQGPRL